uniref:Ankyrin repeat, SAM and basic leucine zipper domain containing 1 n=1 Tax=Tetraodon nigroviridis TaxID=99883 RepID=H3BZM2_TETNG
RIMDRTFPAGEENEDSGDEWDIGISYEKTSFVQQDLDAVASGKDDVMLKRAITNGDTETVRQLLDKGLDVEMRLDFGWTPMCAVSVADYNVAELLLERGADASFHKADGWSVLMACITASAQEDRITRCVELLLSRNADPNVADRSQMTCLMLAAKRGHAKVINLLMVFGAEINAQDSYGYTALSIAVQHRRQEAVLKLLQLGADKTIRTNTGKCPADLAAIFKNTEMSKILASSQPISASQASSSMENTLSQFFATSGEVSSAKECGRKLDELQLLLHGLDLGSLTDIMAKNDITWSHLLSMDKEDLEEIGVTDPGDQQKVLDALRQMNLGKVDLETIDRFGGADSGSEELCNFLTIQDVIGRIPCHPSKIAFALDPEKEAQTLCNQLVIQTGDLQKEVTCLRKLLCQLDHEECCQPPPPEPCGPWGRQVLSGAALGVLGATCLLVLYGATSGCFT